MNRCPKQEQKKSEDLSCGSEFAAHELRSWGESLSASLSSKMCVQVWGEGLDEMIAQVSVITLLLWRQALHASNMC